MDPERLKVQNMLSTTTLAQFQGWLSRAKSERTWLILVYHAVTSNPTEYDTAVPDFLPQIQAIKNSGLPVVTVNQGLNEVMFQSA